MKTNTHVWFSFHPDIVYIYKQWYEHRIKTIVTPILAGIQLMHFQIKTKALNYESLKDQIQCNLQSLAFMEPNVKYYNRSKNNTKAIKLSNSY